MENVIYQIINTVNDKSYIGSAILFNRRITKHKVELKKGTHHNNHLQRAYNKYGKNNFKFIVLEQGVADDLLIIREQYYIDIINPSYNICRTAGSAKGRIVSLETRKKMGNANKGKIRSAGTCLKLSISHIGHPVSDEVKNALSIRMKGNKFGAGNTNRRKVTKEIYIQVIKLREQNLGCRKIAKITGLDKGTILNIFNNKFNYV